MDPTVPVYYSLIAPRAHTSTAKLMIAIRGGSSHAGKTLQTIAVPMQRSGLRVTQIRIEDFMSNQNAFEIAFLHSKIDP